MTTAHDPLAELHADLIRAAGGMGCQSLSDVLRARVLPLAVSALRLLSCPGGNLCHADHVAFLRAALDALTGEKGANVTGAAGPSART